MRLSSSPATHAMICVKRNLTPRVFSCCSVLQCVAVRVAAQCCVLQCFAVRCSLSLSAVSSSSRPVARQPRKTSENSW